MDVKLARGTEPGVNHLHLKLRNKNRWLLVYTLLGLSFLAFYLLVKFKVLALLEEKVPAAPRILLSAFISVVILFLAKVTEGVVIKRAHRRSVSYNLVKLVRLVALVLIVLVIISFLFQNWYTAAVSLGLISLLLGFALQTPISSFIGWINILVRAPYHVGDRIQINDFKGDVVEISYFDTTLWEFGGDYLTSDIHSGRLIRFPNSLVLQSPVYNYSWRKFPYIWNEIPFHVAYGCDLTFVISTIKTIARQELGAEMESKISRFKELIKQTPIDELDIKEYPFVNVRINSNTWVEVLVVYLVEPRHASELRNRLIQKILAALNKSPEKVLFPKGDAR